MIYQYQIRLLIVIGESEWFLMVQKIISSLTTIILSILFPLARWATIEMLSNSPPTFPIAPGEWATTKGTPCSSTACRLLCLEPVCNVMRGAVGVRVWEMWPTESVKEIMS